MATIINPTPCRVCGEVRKGHPYDKKKFEKHDFVGVMQPTRPGVLMDCDCGVQACVDRRASEMDWIEQAALLRADGWHIISGRWMCDSCYQRYREGQTNKLAKQNRKQRR